MLDMQVKAWFRLLYEVQHTSCITIREQDMAEIKEQFQAALARKFLTTEEVAALLRTSPESVRFWRHASRGPRSFKVGRRVLYAVEDVEDFIAAARAA